MKAKYLALCALAVAGLAFTACDEDPMNMDLSVIKDSQTPKNDLDRWLDKNFVDRYNIELKYRWEDNEISMDYILVPASYQNAARMARLIKYICFDSFDEVTGGPEFVRKSFPKHIQLVGNPGWNSNAGWAGAGSYTLGSSEGGHKINLWYVNHLGDVVYENWMPKDSVIRDRKELNHTYFHTIIHEYGHVFHQTVPYTNEFNQVTGKNYLGGMWTNVFGSETDPEIYARGFVTAYGAYSADEDFAEIFSTYVCSTDEEWNAILNAATETGRNTILTKFRLVHDYFSENWQLDIDALRQAVQKREDDLQNQDFNDLSL